MVTNKLSSSILRKLKKRKLYKMSTIPSMKSVITTRVDPMQATRLYADSRIIGSTSMCPAGAPYINFDEYYRPVGGSSRRSLKLDDASCSSLVYSVKQKLGHENTERPILGPCNPGDRRGDDFLYGNFRSNMARNIYKDNKSANFVSPYQGSNMREADQPSSIMSTYEPQTARSGSLSHNALIQPNR